MKLIECYIENFGRLSSFTYRFDAGMNILCEENGWGKSTFAAFIKAMLYGFTPTRSKSISQNERQKYLPWQGGVCGGSLTFETDDGARLRVERTFGAKEAQDTYRLYDGVTGLPSTAFSEKLGEELFGIDAAGYERSTYISEKLTSDDAKDYTGIQAKLVEMQDLSDYKIACDRLDKQRRRYSAQGGHGLIPDTEAALSRARRELTASEEALANTNELGKRSLEFEQQRLAREAELRNLRREVAASLAARSSRAFAAHAKELTDRARETREQVDACAARLSGKVPTIAEVDEQIRIQRRLAESTKPELPALTLPRLLPILKFIAGVLFIPAGILLGRAAKLFYALGPILGLLLIAGGIILTFLRRRQAETRAVMEASRAEYDSTAARLQAFLAHFPVVLADTTLTDDERRLWRVREWVEAYRLAVHDAEQAQSQADSFRAAHPEAFAPERELTPEELSGDEREQALTREIDRLREEQEQCRRQIARFAADAERYTERAQAIASLEAKKAAYEKSYEILRATMDYLKAAHDGLTTRYLGSIQRHFREYMKLLTEEENDTPVADEYTTEAYTVTPDFAVQVTRFGQTKPSEVLSRGGRDLVALCLRFAISDALFGGTKPFLILDDPFINLDDEKVKSAMELLRRIARERQILYVCCHTSRA